MQVQFLGSGDAFGSGGRFNTCIRLVRGAGDVLVDCGATSLVAMRRFGVDPNDVAAVLVSHLHGDHFGGLPFLIVDGQFRGRTRPLVIAGPPGLEARLEAAMEVFLPGSSAIRRKFAVEVVELVPGAPRGIVGVEVTPFVVEHACGAPPFALRIRCDGKVVTYTGDTEWTDALVDAGRGADLLIAEAYFFERRIKWHLDWASLRDHLPAFGAKRVVLTHMGPDMLARRHETGCETAEDGMVVEV
jgi:ribonuclease BN (tRNA processing enzyme)